jgi:type IV pilus assembly protein PilA
MLLLIPEFKTTVPGNKELSGTGENNQMRNKQKGFSLIELLIVVAIILIIAAIAIPNLLRAKIAANQASAVGSLRTLNTACIAYSTSYNQFPSALSNLGPIGSNGTASSTSADLIDSVLAAGTKSGYTFHYTAGSLNQSYTITATPITAATTGQNMYFTDQSGVIRVDTSGSGASASSTPIG